MILDFLKKLDELGDAGTDIREAIEKLGGLNGDVHDSSVNALKALDEGLGKHMDDIAASRTAANNHIATLNKSLDSAGSFRRLIEETVALLEKQKILSEQHIKKIAGAIETIKVAPEDMAKHEEEKEVEPVPLPKGEFSGEPKGEPFFKPVPGKREPNEIQF